MATEDRCVRRPRSAPGRNRSHGARPDHKQAPAAGRTAYCCARRKKRLQWATTAASLTVGVAGIEVGRGLRKHLISRHFLNHPQPDRAYHHRIDRRAMITSRREEAAAWQVRGGGRAGVTGNSRGEYFSRGKIWLTGNGTRVVTVAGRPDFSDEAAARIDRERHGARRHAGGGRRA